MNKTDADKFNSLICSFCNVIKRSKSTKADIGNVLKAVEVFFGATLIARFRSEREFHEHWDGVSERTFAFSKRAYGAATESTQH